MPAERIWVRTQPALLDADLPSPPPISNSAIHKAPTQFCPSGSTPPSTRPGRATSTLPSMRASTQRSSITPFRAADPSGQASSTQTAWVEPARPAPSNRGRLDWGLPGHPALSVRSQARSAVRMALFVLDLASSSFRTAPQPSARLRTSPHVSSGLLTEEAGLLRSCDVSPERRHASLCLWLPSSGPLSPSPLEPGPIPQPAAANLRPSIPRFD